MGRNSTENMLTTLSKISLRDNKIPIYFWISYVLFEGINMGIHTGSFERSFVSILVQLPILLLASYWHLNFTIKRFFLKGKIFDFILSMVIGGLVFGLLRRCVTYLIIYKLYMPEGLNMPLIYWPKILHETMQLHMVVSLFIVVLLVRDALVQQEITNSYKQEKLEAEYKLLQSQVHPHFLFNTLNNLVSVSLHDHDQMPNLLHRLAGLLRYQMHESSKKRVSLIKEIDYLNDYISLEKIRYGDRLDVQTNFSELDSISDIYIPPLLLLPFVENAFKHGASQTETDCWINIRLTYNYSRFVFKVENSIPENETVLTSTGIGLDNLKKRLEILFPGNYEVVTLKENGQFLAALKFNNN